MNAAGAITSILSDLFDDQHDCTTAGSAEEALEKFAKGDYPVSSQRHHDAWHERS